MARARFAFGADSALDTEQDVCVVKVEIGAEIVANLVAVALVAMSAAAVACVRLAVILQGKFIF